MLFLSRKTAPNLLPLSCRILLTTERHAPQADFPSPPFARSSHHKAYDLDTSRHTPSPYYGIRLNINLARGGGHQSTAAWQYSERSWLSTSPKQARFSSTKALPWESPPQPWHVRLSQMRTKLNQLMRGVVVKEPLDWQARVKSLRLWGVLLKKEDGKKSG